MYKERGNVKTAVATSPTPQRNDLWVEPQRLQEIIHHFELEGNGTDHELHIHCNPDNPYEYYRFRPEAITTNHRGVALFGSFRERVTDAGDTWQRGCFFSPHDSTRPGWRLVEQHFVTAWDELKAA